MRGLDDGEVDDARDAGDAGDAGDARTGGPWPKDGVGGDGVTGGGRGGTPWGTGSTAAGVTAVAGLAALGLFVAACSTGGTGSRDEGAARADSTTAAAPTPSTAVSGSEKAVEWVDPIALLKGDPKIGDRLKADLKPCAADAYPVDTSYGNLTDGAAPDVVVNVMTCGDAVGIGTYVYRKQSGGGASADGYENVFMAEDAAVFGTIDRGELVVTKQVYAENDPVAYPSGEDVLTYRWSGSRFVQHDWVHNEYSRAVGEVDGTAGLPQPVPGRSDAG
ncbi:hypothetical protein [Streptomyces sp. CC208A]|uniref:hypothetical protein n=1 Tax=Streptomyces sp. CC208A TaxID=3044573 RepID=UPI0024A91123|nr:hypothetical protein [Streptomyces sp. CC208A]